MAVLQAARAHVLGLPLASAYSWGLNRAIFYAAAKRGFKGHGGSAGGSPSGRGALPRKKPDEYRLGDDFAFIDPKSGKDRPTFVFGGEPQTQEDFERQIVGRFQGTFQKAWREAVDYVNMFDREALLSSTRFYSEVYHPRRDALADEWDERSRGSGNGQGARPSRSGRGSK